MQFAVHPSVYSTDKSSRGLLNMLEQVWVRNKTPGDGTFFIISGFANYNGGVRFYNVFKEHTSKGGDCIVILGGSNSQNLSSQQVVEELLSVGCRVFLINRKRILHAKCYGSDTSHGESLIVSSGNFTGPGMSQNIEASVLIEGEPLRASNFSWREFFSNIRSQNWDIYEPSLEHREDPAWRLLYDEVGGAIKLPEEQEITLLITLSHSDTARIQADYGEPASLGSQYFWLSKDSYDFFPPLTIRNKRGYKATYSTLINMNYLDIEVIDNECRVTFEAENNLDFRLGTGKLRYTKIAAEGDLAAISRLGERDYTLKIIARTDPSYTGLLRYAINFIGHEGKRYGYISNLDYSRIFQENSV